MDVNFWGTYYLDTAFLPHLQQRPEAALVNASSMGALVPVPGPGVYGASKAAVTLLTECMYAEFKDTSVAITLARIAPVRAITAVADRLKALLG